MEQNSAEGRIRSAALRLFAQRGFEATGIRDIARDAGVSSAALYHYMGSKEDLLVRIMTTGMERLDQACRKSVALFPTPEERMVALVHLHVIFHAHDQLWAIVSDQELRALSAEARRKVTPLTDGYEKLWQQTLDQGVRCGTFRVANTKVIRLALLGMCTEVARWFTSTGPMTAWEVAAIYADAALAVVDARRDNTPFRLKDLASDETSRYTDLIAGLLPDPLSSVL